MAASIATDPAADMTTAQINERTDGGEDGNKQKRGRYEKELTVVLETEGGEVTAMNLIRAAKEVCGKLTACRMITGDKYEVTVANVQAKARLLDGFRVGGARIHGREVTSDELVVSFMGLTAYIEDGEIVAKLFAKIKTNLNMWRLRNLGLKGKVLVANCLCLSKLNHALAVYDLPDEALNALNLMVSNFIWKRDRGFIAFKTLLNRYDEVGLNLVDILTRKRAFRVKLIRRVLDPACAPDAGESRRVCPPTVGGPPGWVALQ